MSERPRKLNCEQRAAVTADPGRPLAVVAGAGTGKTAVLIARFAWMVRRGCSPDQLVMLTFTEKAAWEMRQRLQEQLGHAPPWVGTYHWFAQEILRRYGESRGIAGFRIVDEVESACLMRRALFACLEEGRVSEELGMRPGRTAEDALLLYQRLQDYLVDPTRPETWLTEDADQTERRLAEDLAAVFAHYQQLLTRENAMDFGGLLQRCHQLLAGTDELRREVQRQFRHVLVDEFQDTNYAQLQITRLLSPEGRLQNVTVVGDPRQAIYGWRGARPKNLRDFTESAPGCEVVQLVRNYRSYGEILRCAEVVVSGADAYSAELIPARRGWAGYPVITVWECQDPEQEAAAVAGRVLELLDDGIQPGEIGVLLRGMRGSGVLLDALEALDIPFSVSGGPGLAASQAYKDLCAAFRLLADPEDDAAWARIAQTGGWLGQQGRRPGADRRVLIEQLRIRADGYGLREAVEAAFQMADSTRWLAGLGYGSRARWEWEALVRLRHWVWRWVELHPSASWAELVEYLEAARAAGGLPEPEWPDTAGVRVMTVHQAKGLEFDRVILAGVSPYSFPSRLRYARLGYLPPWGFWAKEDALGEPVGRFQAIRKELAEQHWAEERRLWYVAVTRARLGVDVFARGLEVLPGAPYFVAEMLQADALRCAVRVQRARPAGGRLAAKHPRFEEVARRQRAGSGARWRRGAGGGRRREARRE